jgi:hypothetical protein
MGAREFYEFVDVAEYGATFGCSGDRDSAATTKVQ